MEKRTWIIIAIIAIIFVAWWGYNIIDNGKIKVEYEYEITAVNQYTDGKGTVHYPSAGNMFVRADIYESNVSDGYVLGLPNCYSLKHPDGNNYDWTTGYTDCPNIPPRGSANIVTIFEVPNMTTKAIVFWNSPYVQAKCINH